MRFLADENFPSNAVANLKAAGHDIVWVRTAAPVEFCLRSILGPPQDRHLRTNTQYEGLTTNIETKPLQEPSSLRRHFELSNKLKVKRRFTWALREARFLC
jgi:hypothetical protein